MIRPSEVLKPLGMSVLEEVRATAAAGVVILLAAALCRAVEDRIEARIEARAAAIQAEADTSDEVEKPEELVVCHPCRGGRHRDCVDALCACVEGLCEPLLKPACPDCGYVRCECP